MTGGFVVWTDCYKHDGSVYITGYTAGSLDGQSNSGMKDAFLTIFSKKNMNYWNIYLIFA